MSPRGIKQRLGKLTASLTAHEVPEHLHHGLSRYLTHGVRPGGYLCAVLRYDLEDAAMRADSVNAARLDRIVMGVQDGLPASAWGSKKDLEAWVKRGGLTGRIEMGR